MEKKNIDKEMVSEALQSHAQTISDHISEGPNDWAQPWELYSTK